jgi:hypothetical protein
MNVSIDFLVCALSKRYELSKPKVLNDLITVEGVAYLQEQNKNLYGKNRFVPLTKKYYGLAAGILSEYYKNGKHKKG